MKRAGGWGVAALLAIRCWVASAETGRAVIQGISEGSSVSGTATLADTPEGLMVSIRVAGVAPGQHGWHIHEFGGCGDGGNAAGGHYNPAGVPHGFLPKDGLAKAHPGDLGNIEVGPDGSGALTVTLPGVMLQSGTYNVAGRAIILHEKMDDFGQPTGNAGGRIGCGPILITTD
jgi:Cu-Zn family superoxide dismutase